MRNELEICNHLMDDMKPLECSNSLTNQIVIYKTTNVLSSALKQLKRCLISIQGTSTDSERTFSISGQIMTSNRTSMSSEMLNKLLLLNKFYN